MIKFLSVFWMLLRHPLVGKHKKILFIGLPLLYFIMPDFIPFIIDDLLVLALGVWSFFQSAKKDVSKDGEVIDIEAREIRENGERS